MRSSTLCAVGAAALLALAPGAARAQSASDSLPVYRREIFTYTGGARPDPFRSLLDDAELGVRLEDLTLRGVVYHPDPARSVAVLSRRGVGHPIRARQGDRVGGVQIVAIRPRAVDVVLEEFGVARRAQLELKTAAKKGDES